MKGSKNTNTWFLITIAGLMTAWIGASAVNHNTLEQNTLIQDEHKTQVQITADKNKQETLSDSHENSMENNIDKASHVVAHVINKVIPHSAIQENIPAPPLVSSAREQIGVTVRYDPAYVKLDFPMGDVPKDRGVCTDVVVRAYREQGRDLQALVNADMKKAWSKYPKNWGLKRPDKNIDHRRVPNLRVFFTRHGKSLGVSENPQDYQAGDLVTWKIDGRLPHIGIVSNKTKADGTPLIIHNIGLGTQEQDMLFDYPITGHYRY